jgi:putative aminopeptidase FrvX
MQNWKVQPEVITGPDLMDCVMLKFGEPRTAAVAHMDTVGFNVRYENQLIPIGSPEVKDGDLICGSDNLGIIECKLRLEDTKNLYYDFGRAIQRGTTLIYKPYYNQDEDVVTATFLDNRAGVFNLLKVAETLQDGLLIFSCWEEHGGGSMPILIRHMWERFKIRKVLISDITWASDGVLTGDGVVISIRDYNIPRRSFIDGIIKIAEASNIGFQLEVESSGSSDGREIQLSPYPIDWCFIGAPSENAHSSREVISSKDLICMVDLYQLLFRTL